MKVLLINGSPHEKGCTYIALAEAAKELEAQGIETELFWIGAAPVGGCIGCGGCNTVCITCSCFDTTDVIYHETSRDGERRRAWSSCMLDSYSTMAGGHNVRAKAGDRMRFKAMHKTYDFKARFGEENMCVGCGRCDMRCPKDIHFSETVDKLAHEVERLKKGEEQA